MDSRLARPAMFPSPETIYNLRGNELRRFLSFSRRLMNLHVSRNLFDHARYLPQELEVILGDGGGIERVER